MDYKRKRDNGANEGENSSLKILKLDISHNNSNNSNSSKYDEFINRSISEWSVKELKQFAIKIGLNFGSGSVGRKQDIYEKILNFVRNQMSIRDEQIKKESINTFNTLAPALAINEGLDRLEVAFWRVFRNKVIFNCIVSNFKFKQVYNYDRLYSVVYIINNYSNSSEILRDKVKSNSYLHFNKSSTYEDLQLVCNLIYQDNQDTATFYTSLFQNYFNYEPAITLTRDLIYSGNLVALKSFNVSQHENIIKEAILYEFRYSIKDVKDFKMLKYIYSIVGNCLKSNHLIIKFYNLYQDSIQLNDILEIIQFFLQFQSNDSQFISQFKEIKESINFTNNQLNSTLFQLLLQYSVIFEQNNNNNNISFINNISNSNDNSSNNVNDDNSNNNNNNQIKTSIYKIINFYYSLIDVNEMNKPIEHYLIFNQKNEIIQVLSKLNELNLYRSECLFKLFKLKIDKQFFESLLKSFPKNHQLMDLALKSIIRYSNIQLLDMYIKEFSLGYFSKKLILVYSSLSSTQILDYIFQNYQSAFTMDSNQGKYWIHFNSTDILDHFEVLMQSLGIKMDLSDNRQILHSYYSKKYTKDITLELLYRIIVNKSDQYQIKLESSLDSYSLGITESLKVDSKSQDFLISLYKLGYTLDNGFIPIDQSTKIHKFAEWYIQNINSRGIHRTSNQDRDFYSKLLFISGHYEELFNLNYNINKYEQLMNGFEERKTKQLYFNSFITTSFIDHLFKYIKTSGTPINNSTLQTLDDSFNLKRFLQIIIKSSNLNLLKHICLNYNYLLYKKSKSNPHGTDSTILKMVLLEALQTNYQISKLILNYIPTTQRELDSLSTDPRYPWLKELNK